MNVIAEMDIKEKRSLLRALKDFIQRIKNYLKKYGLAETKAFVDDFEAINKLANMVNESIVQEKNKANVEKHSFVGPNSLTANQSLYQEALQLEKDGVDTESIRQQTGWFKTYDGKWRYEINDKDAVWLFKATDKLNKAKTYLKLENRYKALEDKIDNNTITDKEFDEYYDLDERIINYKNSIKLIDCIDHPQLFEAYPQLKNIKVSFASITENGVYNPKTNSIIINPKTNTERTTDDIKKTLLHEIQHIIQHIEGFSSGSSISYWIDRLSEEKYKDLQKRKNNLLKSVDEDLKKYINEYSIKMTSDNLSFKDMRELYREYASAFIHSEKLLTRFYDYAQDFENYIRYINSANLYNDAIDYYQNTAGEIEARDTTNRMNYSSKQRKNIRPDIDRKDVVFADASGVSNSITEPFVDNNGTRFENAVLLDTDFFDGMSPRNWGKKLRQYVFNRSQNKPFILPVLDESSNVQILQFAKKNDRVRKNGSNTHLVLNELVNTTDNLSKLAVIHINEIIAVSEESNPYYSNDNSHGWMDKNGWLHRTANIINIKNGNIYEITIDIPKTNDGRALLYATKGKIKKVGQTDVKSLKIKASRSHSNFDNIISDTTEKSNTKYSLTEIDNKYMSAVESGDMETAQRMVDEMAKANGYDSPMLYHGTYESRARDKNGEFLDRDFSVFDSTKSMADRVDGSGFYFTDNKKLAEFYAPKNQYNKPRIFNVYLKISNILEVEGNGSNWNQIFFEKITYKYPVPGGGYKTTHEVMTKEISRYAKKEGYDGVIIKNIIDGKANEKEYLSNVYVVFNSNQIKSADSVTYDDDGNIIPLSERFKDSNKDIRYSLSDVTVKDIEDLRSIGRKSINDFTSDEIHKTEKWARKFYNELGTKSPFFRAWFGDWRAYDTQKVNIAKIKDNSRGLQKNIDTGWEINVSAKIFNETKAHKSNKAKKALPYLNYINDIVKNAILFDTYSLDKAKSENSLFMHSMYAVVNIENKTEVLKLYVEEMNNPNYVNTNKRAYQLQYIEKAPTASVRVQGNTSSSLTNTVSAVKTVSDLYALVKQYDSKFNPKPVNSILLNEDGTPKVFYHGTNKHFTEFKPNEIALREGSFFFAENIEDAKAYGENVYEVYLTGNLADYDNQPSEFYKLKNKREQVEYLKHQNYDGWYADMDSEGWGEVSVFNSSQIKSATDNIGTFNKYNADIRFSLTEPGEITDADIVDLFEDSEEAFDYDFTADNIKMSHETKEAIKDTIKTLVELNTLTQNKRISDNDLRKLCKQAIQKCDSKQNLDVFVNYIA